MSASEKQWLVTAYIQVQKIKWANSKLYAHGKNLNRTFDMLLIASHDKLLILASIQI